MALHFDVCVVVHRREKCQQEIQAMAAKRRARTNESHCGQTLTVTSGHHRHSHRNRVLIEFCERGNYSIQEVKRLYYANNVHDEMQWKSGGFVCAPYLTRHMLIYFA